MFIAVLFTTAREMEATWMSLNRWVDKGDVVHIDNGMLLSHKKEWNCAIFRDVDGPRDWHTEWSQKEKNKYSMTSLICGI